MSSPAARPPHSCRDAVSAAKREFGGVDQIKEAFRDQRGLPLVDALRVEGSRVLMSQPGHQGRGKQYPYNAMVEIDVSVAGVKTTHSFFCHGDTIVMKALPVGMR